jgi:hypothetical protein
MLLVIESMFFIAGMWALVSGQLPLGLLRLLFGRGEYPVSTNRARLYGAVLASPLPVGLIISFLFEPVLDSSVIGILIAFEYIYLIAIMITAILFASKIRRPSESYTDDGTPTGLESVQGRSYAARLLIIFGLASLSCIIIVSIGALVFTIISSLKTGVALSDNLSQDLLVFILLFLIIGIGLFASFRLVKQMRM